jgi:hypothetical protein
MPPTAQQLKRCLLQSATTYNEHSAELVAEAWTYLLENRLWIDVYPSLERLQDDLNFNHCIKPTLTSHANTKRRKQSDIAAITKNWGCSPNQLLPLDMAPSFYSSNFLRTLNRLSKACSLEAATPLLVKAIEARVSKPKASEEEHLHTDDLKKVLADIKLIENETPLSSTWVGNSGAEDDGARLAIGGLNGPGLQLLLEASQEVRVHAGQAGEDAAPTGEAVQTETVRAKERSPLQNER